MGRIENYILDQAITPDDIVLGSDADDYNKTKNYTVEGLGTFISTNYNSGEVQDNILKSVYLGSLSEQSPVTATVSQINQLTQFVVLPSEIYFFSIIIGENFYVYAFRNIGKGTYGVGGTQLTSSNLQLISKRSLSVNTITEDTDTDTINLGNITGSNIEDIVNALNPPKDIQPLSDGFTVFSGTDNGDDVSYLFLGESGLTGVGENQTTSDDFKLLTQTDVSILTPATATPPVSGTFSIDLTNYLGTDYSGSTTSLTSLDIAPNAVQSGFARVKGNWSTQPTFTGATEAENSTFTADTVIYLYVEKWSDGVIYWYSEN